MNRLFYGDNLHVMRDLMGNHAVDLIYLDPPFKSNKNYNLMYSRRVGRPIPEQEEAFCDTWEMDAEKRELVKAMPALMREQGIDDYYVQFWRYWMNALRHTQPQLLAYLIYMVQRLMYMKLILKPTGSIYLHCDPEASHYIKVMMDAIFGHRNFRNELVWCYEVGSRSKAHFGRKHDTILYYSKGDKYTFNADAVRQKRKKTHMKVEIDEDGREWQVKTDAKTGKEYRYAVDKGVLCPDWWTDIPSLNRSAKERLGFPTQKPKDLLRRIIEASSNPGDVVFDPFCGCGTAVYAAHETGRQWIGCDIAVLAIRLIEDQLGIWYNLERDKEFKTTGVPNSVESATRLFKQDPFQFEHWIVERVGAFPTKKTGDKGVDGVMYYDLDGEMDMGKMIFSVKGGNIRPSDVRDLEGTRSVDEDAHLSGFISLKEPTKAMREAASEAGLWHYKGETYERVQMLTVKEIVEEKRLFNTPTRVQYRDDHLQQSLKL